MNVQVVVAIFVVFVFAVTAQAEETRWPKVAALEKTFYFPDGKTAEIELTIHSTEGEPVYLLECHTFSYEGDQSFEALCRLEWVHERASSSPSPQPACGLA